MPILIVFALAMFWTSSLAGPLTLQGTVNYNDANLRIGAFWVDRSNNLNAEISSVSLNQNGIFALNIPEKIPNQAITTPFNRENFSFPGIFSQFMVNSSALFCQIKLFVYSDSDFSNSYNSSDKIFDTFVSLSNKNLQIIWLQKPIKVQGNSLFVDLPAGLSILLTELGKNQTKLSITNQISDLLVDVF